MVAAPHFAEEQTMQRQRFKVTLRCGGSDSVMWTNRLAELESVLHLAITGSQSDWRMACAVLDTVTGAYAEITAAAPLGFVAAVRDLFSAVLAAQPRELRDGEGRDVVVEVQFAAHDATLAQCRQFAADAMSKALMDFTHDAQRAEPQYSVNGEGVGDAWFQGE
jgi:hypothetical protein